MKYGFPSIFSALALAVILSGCSTSQDVVTNGPIQKRKYNKGWHVDLRTPGNKQAQVDRYYSDEDAPAPVTTNAIIQIMHPEPPKAELHQVPMVSMPSRSKAPIPANDIRGSELLASVQEYLPAPVAQLVERHTYNVPIPQEGSSGTNGFAIAGFVCAFFIPILGIIFSAIAMGQIKRTGEKGYGLALAGLIISLLTIVLFVSLI